MMNEWVLIGILCFYGLVFVVCLVTGIRDLRENLRYAQRKGSRRFDLDKFCADFSRDDPVKDPYVLIHNRWIDRSFPES